MHGVLIFAVHINEMHVTFSDDTTSGFRMLPGALFGSKDTVGGLEGLIKISFYLILNSKRILAHPVSSIRYSCHCPQTSPMLPICPCIRSLYTEEQCFGVSSVVGSYWGFTRENFRVLYHETTTDVVSTRFLTLCWS